MGERKGMHRSSRVASLALALALSLAEAAPATDVAAAGAAAPDWQAAAKEVRTVLGELVAADTTNPPGNEARAAAIGARRLAGAKIPFERLEFAPGRENLVARLRGDGSGRPLLLLAHTDVVGVAGQSWTTDPHRLTEVDGYLQARGASDDLGMAAVELEVLLLLRRRGVPLARDVILAWTGDEESGGAGIRWLLEQRPGSIDAEIALNEGGGVRLGPDGRPAFVELQTAEKVYQDFRVTAHGPTGHSSVPLPDNAIYRLARALLRLEAHEFPARLLPVTRAWLRARGAVEADPIASAMRRLAEAEGELPADALAVVDANPVLAASLRTTCVATLIEGGSRANALPARAEANLNCRLLPDRTPAWAKRELLSILDDSSLEVEASEEFGFGEPSPLDGPAPAAIRRIAAEMWPGIHVIPFMSRGATDSRFLRARGQHAYGIDPIALGEEDARRAHGIDERIPAASLAPAVEFLYRLVVSLAGR